MCQEKFPLPPRFLILVWFCREFNSPSNDTIYFNFGYVLAEKIRHCNWDITVKLSKIKRLPNRIRYEFVTANRTRPFWLFLSFFYKKWAGYDVFQWWRYWIMFSWSIWFDRTEPNFFTKKHKNKQKISKSSGPWQNRISSIEFGLVRFDSVRNFI